MSYLSYLYGTYSFLLSPKRSSAIVLAGSLDIFDTKSEIRSVRPKMVSFKLRSLVTGRNLIKKSD